jgi:hypothetical protein
MGGFSDATPISYFQRKEVIDMATIAAIYTSPAIVDPIKELFTEILRLSAHQ